jgi:hypothetical protein
LLKGPGWSEEWARFQAGKHRRELEIVGDHKYVVGSEQKQRLIVKLRRVRSRSRS